jgi:hypothetical protein
MAIDRVDETLMRPLKLIRPALSQRHNFVLEW